MPPDVISHENQLQHLSEPSIFILDVFRTADHAGQIFIPHRPQICGLAEFKPQLLLSRPEIYFKPAWGSTCNHDGGGNKPYSAASALGKGYF